MKRIQAGRRAMHLDMQMKRVGLFLGVLLLASCRTMAGDPGAPPLLKLRAGAAPATATAQLTGTLVRRGDCLAIDGNGSTVVIWPRTADARSVPAGINVIVIWPRSATLRPGESGGGEAGINTVVIWSRAVGHGTPIRVGERVELIGDMKDDMSGLALDRPAPRGCAGRAFVVRDFRPAGAAEAE